MAHHIILLKPNTKFPVFKNFLTNSQLFDRSRKNFKWRYNTDLIGTYIQENRNLGFFLFFFEKIWWAQFFEFRWISSYVSKNVYMIEPCLYLCWRFLHTPLQRQIILINVIENRYFQCNKTKSFQYTRYLHALCFISNDF